MHVCWCHDILQRIEGYYGPVYENFALRDPVLATAVEVGVVCVYGYDRECHLHCCAMFFEV